MPQKTSGYQALDRKTNCIVAREKKEFLKAGELKNN